MCGIAGAFAFDPRVEPPDPADVARMTDVMHARGPDAGGSWRSGDGRVVLGHRRLSIIDPSERGAQPMADPEGRRVVTYNGEIYNHVTLRKQLLARGHAFRSDSDTEALLHLFSERGEALIEQLRGMFAFALWDAQRGALFLARDPHGIKPLYWSSRRGVFRFASQVRALEASTHVSRALDPAGLVGFLSFGSVPEPWTIREDIQALPAGTTLWVDERGPATPKRVFSLARVYAEATERARQPTSGVRERMREALLDSVRHHLVSDVPVGAFLSAGIDSSALVALMCETAPEPPTTVTLAFDEFRGTHDDEVPLAEATARRLGTRHTTRRVAREELARDLPAILDAMDQPSVDGLNTWFVSKAARERGLKVAVSGLGGDELWGGYPSFRDVPRAVRWLRLPARWPGLGRGWRRATAPLWPWTPWSSKLAGLVEHGGSYPGAYLLRRGLFMPWELDALVGRDLVEAGLKRFDPIGYAQSAIEIDPGSAFGRVAVLEGAIYMRNQLLRDTDWASMAHSLEVRTPLVDWTLARAVAPLVLADPAGAKQRLAQCPEPPLPEELARRPKTGFSTPIAGWLEHGELDAWRRVPLLRHRHCHWSRRWGYVLAQHWR